LQGADHQPEDRERVRPGDLEVCRVKARRDVVDLADQFVGEDVSGGGGAAGDLVEQRGRRAAVGALVAVLGRQIGADERLESRPIGRLGVEALALGAQLVGEDVRDEILLGGEVAVERAPLVRPASDTTAATPAPSMPSSLKRRPAASTMRCRVASFWCLPYRIATSLVGLVSIELWELPRGAPDT
jgi:hypothetical protein